ncbi:MAG: carboxypeptidase-like regulatory protein [Segetibacter sp.]|nr:carboxypeptidase-like regulatory protein [Segetibacter sp.]
MKVLVALGFFFVFPLFAIGQFHLSGTVVNGTDEKPLQGASVFINNGSIGTVTNAEGKFTLSAISVSNFELVISFVNYQTIVVKISPDNISKRFMIKMEPKPEELKEVVIGPVLKDGWATWGRTFTDMFLGTSKNATECVIKNPKVLRFRYDKKNRVLKVTSLDKLVIVNNALGLQIDYQLEEFRYEGKAQMITFYGYSSFKRMSTKRPRKQQDWIEKRREAYNGSMMHFIRSVYNNNTEHEGFELRQLIRLYKNDSLFRPYYDSIMKGINTIFDTAKYSIQLMKGGGFSKDPIIYALSKQPMSGSTIRVYDSASKAWYLIFQFNLQLVYKNEFEKEEYVAQSRPNTKTRQHETSILHLPNHRAVMVEKNGLYFDPLDLFSEGYLGWEKMAEMLPNDYEPGD